jgi:heme-degrading monooxygenase HmoA
MTANYLLTRKRTSPNTNQHPGQRWSATHACSPEPVPGVSAGKGKKPLPRSAAGTPAGRRGGHMLVKVLIRRRFKKGTKAEVAALITRFRAGAVNQPGYICGETLTDVEDPQVKLVIATWKDLASWQTWRNSSTRREFEAMLDVFQDNPTEYATYVLDG